MIAASKEPADQQAREIRDWYQERITRSLWFGCIVLQPDCTSSSRARETRRGVEVLQGIDGSRTNTASEMRVARPRLKLEFAEAANLICLVQLLEKVRSSNRLAIEATDISGKFHLDHALERLEGTHANGGAGWLRWAIFDLAGQAIENTLLGLLRWNVLANDLAQTRDLECARTLLTESLADLSRESFEYGGDLLLGQTGCRCNVGHHFRLARSLRTWGFRHRLPPSLRGSWKRKEIENAL